VPAAILARGRLLTAAAVMAITALYALPLMRFDLNPYDEGVVALGAEQVLKGRIPNVDFYVPYPPGVFYVLAGLFRLAGTRLLVERSLAVACVVACSGLGVLLVTRLRPPDRRRPVPEAVLVGLMAVVAGTCMSVLWVTPVTGGVLCLILVGGLALRRALPTGHPFLGLIVGLLLGLAILWRTAFGLSALLATILVWTLRAGHGCGVDTRFVRRRRLVGAATLVLGAALVAAPVFVLLLKLGGERAFRSLFVWPFVSTHQARLPWPALVPRFDPLTLAQQPLLRQGAVLFQNWIYYFPGAAVVLGAWRLLRWRALAPAEIDVGLWLLFLCPGFFLYAGGRTDYVHLLPLFLTTLLLVALCLGGALGERPTRRSWLRLGWLGGGLVLGLSAVAALVPGPLAHWTAKRAAPARFAVELPAPRGAGIRAPYRYARQYGEVLPYLGSIVPAGEKLFSGTSRHDLFMVNDVMLYFLAERDPGSYFWCLDAGVTTTAEVQQQMLQELSAQRVNWAVRWTAACPDKPRGGVPMPGAPLLDQALAAEFVPVERFGWYEVLRRVGSGVMASTPAGDMPGSRGLD
jgi:hypothetical protein